MNWITRTVVERQSVSWGHWGARMLRPIPTSPITLVVPFPTRWGTDIMGRALAELVRQGVKAAGHCGKIGLGPPVILVRLPWRVRIMMAIHY